MRLLRRYLPRWRHFRGLILSPGNTENAMLRFGCIASFFIPPAGRRRPGRSPAALRAASADCRPLRRAERPSGPAGPGGGANPRGGLRPASPASLRRLGHFSPGSVIGSIYFPSFLAAKCRWLSIATSAVTVSTLPSTCPAVTRSPAFSAFSGATPQ